MRAASTNEQNQLFWVQLRTLPYRETTPSKALANTLCASNRAAVQGRQEGASKRVHGAYGYACIVEFIILFDHDPPIGGRPLFSASAMGMDSKASAKARMAYCSTSTTCKPRISSTGRGQTL